ncbi:L-serine dehydratase, iron-sulfur-dependent subunit alpha [Anaerocolumna cellulosilytica]|uniref:L-serine dehydratase n=1 Tax=Anaerocolumna cellulosilytica TaxID=433286 RepID=A0A6S6R3W2_9FIRM|nr:L-serine ammonia-lyase, iron-sulfur-dependent, subunit alpha [Anaerocolumna cellulosilytica]MBB5194049.1 L-serine dehydratase [Anaerocolumna cellulosilytica]BCJ94737.1 L-serine dehydratase, iron-sulfur-dependent subunit alpha [Anaerocolumna cellulosilytica]
MNFKSGQALLEICDVKNISISDAMLLREVQFLGSEEAEVIKKMEHAWEIMKKSARHALAKKIESMGGLIGGEAAKINNRRLTGNVSVCGNLMSKAIMYAMGVLEVNSSMGLIVAAPTAGSSGVIPGALLAIQEEMHFSDSDMIKALFHAGAIGYLIAHNATVAGAEGGCQAEVGSASAMAAAAITELLGGSPRQCLHAATSALSNLLGLVCDPIGGLVEAPCQQRNAMGVSNALVCAEIALSSIEHIVPFDEAVAVMYNVGRSLPNELKETALGGMAAAPSACSRCKKCP